MAIISGWIIDFQKRVAYSRNKQGFIRRNDDGSIETINSLPIYVQAYLRQQRDSQAK